ncbi:hypothetical protein EJ04DRAFT_549713 [Polyplosphaeria fusca]|uniref:Uncharacterized protein n=1 Tax=Polyplosphaeria fusca TaxID=682080 RepID=A0A9P4R8V2_9PLEO|nr:hypothetical protein EJ04DRAFT_549713 [Polyplosphaeria fusca]
MLASRASSAFVCFRCQLRLAQSRAPAPARRPPHASFSASHRRHDEATQVLIPRARSQISERPLERLKKRSRGKRLLRETTAPLEIKTLGEDSGILVLKEVNIPRRNKEEESSEEVILDDTLSSSILDSLKEDEGETTYKEIEAQLESMRPSTSSDPGEPQYITTAKFRELRKTLHESFTVQQLSQYYSDAKGVQQEQVKEQVLQGLGGRKSISRPLESTQWHPGTTPLTSRLPGANLKRFDRAPVNKSMLADQIVRSVWKVVLLEEIEAPGEIELTLKAWQLSLLTVGETPTLLDRICLARRCKMEIYWEDHILRITADKSTAEYAVHDITDALRNTEAHTWNLEPWIPYIDQRPGKARRATFFTQKIMQAISLVTGTSTHSIENNAIRIRGVTKASVEEAERCLINVLPLRDPSKRTINTKMLKKEHALSPIPMKNSLDFRFRDIDMGRWVAPVVKMTEESEVTEAEWLETVEMKKIQDTVLKDLKQNLPTEFVPPPQANVEDQAEWQFKPFVRVEALYGQATFLLPPSHKPKIGRHCKHSVDAAFCTSIPGFPIALTDESAPSAKLYHACLSYEFIYNPRGPNRLNPNIVCPVVEMLVGIPSNGDPILRGVSLRFNEHNYDVLLPNKATDIRFQRFDTLALLNPLEDPNVKEYFEAIRENVKSGQRLTAPAKLAIPIPGFINRKLPGRGHKPRTLEYLLKRIQYRQHLQSQFQDRLLDYASVRGGTLDHVGNSLALSYSPNTLQGVKENDLASFINTSFELADRLTTAAADPVPRSERVGPAKEVQQQSVQPDGEAKSMDELLGESIVENVTVPNEMDGILGDAIQKQTSTHFEADEIDDPSFRSMFYDEEDRVQMGEEPAEQSDAKGVAQQPDNLESIEKGQ